jgi:hypothetical protein
MTDDFYVGYQTKAPRMVGAFIARITAATVACVLAAGALLILTQPRFAASKFEFGVDRDYAGVIETWPYPMLLTAGPRYLLVAPGKHGRSGLVRFESRHVRLRGSLIERGEDRMLQVALGSIKEVAATQTQGGDRPVELGPVKLAGEIVDTKCYLGVMNPGEHKVHRDCAARCISGGLPPGFVVRDAAGQARMLLLTGRDGRPLGHEILPFVGEPVEISGDLVRSGSALILKADPARFRRDSGALPENDHVTRD